MKRLPLYLSGALLLLVASNLLWVELLSGQAQDVLDIGSRLELFVDKYLIAKMDGVQLKLHRPVEAGEVLRFDKPWEGRFSIYGTVIKDGPKYRLYYRGEPVATLDGNEDEVTCYAESDDGISWTKPNLGLFEVKGTRANNLVLDKTSMPAPNNFSPFLDARPGVPADERYKALGGLFNLPERQGRKRNTSGGLLAFASGDGIHWRKLNEKAVINHTHYPVVYNDVSQHCAFWSEQEGQYVAYIRVWKDDGVNPPTEQGFGGNIRWVGRTTSKDFLNWSKVEEMSFGDAPPEHLYTNQTHPYFRAPHIYVGVAARFMPRRQVLSEVEAKALDVDPRYFRDCSDSVLLTTRGGNRYDRTFLEGFLPPGIGMKNWTSRTNFPVRNVVPTGPYEMSLYVQQHYAQPDNLIRRYTMRTDGFSSANAPHRGGEMLTRVLKFSGNQLLINFSTSAAGGIQVEIQDAGGKPLPGYSLGDAREMIGNEIERAVAWSGGNDVSQLAGKPVRLRFVMKDADLYSVRFR